MSAGFDRRALWGVAGLAALSFVAGETLTAYRAARMPKNVAVVAPGALLRAGQLTRGQLRDVVARHGCRLVVCLNPGEDPDEAAAAAALGCRHLALAMPGDGMGEPALFHAFLRALAAPGAGPALVHCSAGSMRTGVAVAAYRVVFEGWTEADAAREFVYYGCPIHRAQALAERLRVTLAALPPDLAELRARGPARAALAGAGRTAPR